ncbi:MAG: glucose-6-phosphate isomerase, partial [Alphaproteobacteria bacterium]|nr:glucose-6-phosphate isomerase [Alphaproteobacteria bacterium]
AVGLAIHRRAAVSVLMPYADRLRTLGLWYCQLWAESLGKGGRGTTPLAARGPADQHSLLQLFLDGPADKWFTVVIADTASDGPRVPATLADAVGLGHLGGRTIGDVVAAQAAATVETLIARGRPTRVLRIDAPRAETLGALFMHFMLETIIAGHLLAVNPFDQPAVEEGKTRTRARLDRP